MARAVDSVPDARRSGGIGIPVATQYAGGRVIGVALSDDHVNVHIVAQRMDVVNIANSVHEAVGRVLRHVGDLRRLSVIVDDLDLDLRGTL